MLLQNVMGTLYNLKNMSKVQYNITNSLQELLKWNHYFTKIKIQKLIMKHSNIIKPKRFT